MFEALHPPVACWYTASRNSGCPRTRAEEIDGLKLHGSEHAAQHGRRPDAFAYDELMGEEGYEAVFIGSGAGLPQFMKIPEGTGLKGSSPPMSF